MRLTAFLSLLSLLFSLTITALPTGEPSIGDSCGRMLLRDPVWGADPFAANLTADSQCHHWEYEDYISWVYYIDAHCLCMFHKKEDCSDTYKTIKTGDANITSGADSFIEGFRCTKLGSVHGDN